MIEAPPDQNYPLRFESDMDFLLNNVEIKFLYQCECLHLFVKYNN